MKGLIIRGGKPLHGEISISGGKNAAVALLPATILCKGVCTIDNLPMIDDVLVLKELLEFLGAHITLTPGRITIDATNLQNRVPPERLVARMRASYYLLGTMLSRFGSAEVPPPGGCYIGARPIDHHLRGFRALGATVTETNMVRLECEKLTGAEIHLEASVGATINCIFAAVFAEGTTTLYNAAKEPHVVDVANLLNNMGASVKGAGTDTVRIRGVKDLHGCNYTIIPDQIETGTFMIMAAATGGNCLLKNCIPPHMEAVSAKLMEAGATIEEGDDWLRVSRTKPLKAVNVKTMVYPGFPTDLQQPFSAMLTLAEGTSVVTETIFEQRYRHFEEMRRMGARVRVEDRVAVVQGVEKLYGRTVEARDLRGGAALVTAGLMAEGETTLYGLEYINRGYENMAGKLLSLGADITPIDN